MPSSASGAVVAACDRCSRCTLVSPPPFAISRSRSNWPARRSDRSPSMASSPVVDRRTSRRPPATWPLRRPRPRAGQACAPARSWSTRIGRIGPPEHYHQRAHRNSIGEPPHGGIGGSVAWLRPYEHGGASRYRPLQSRQPALYRVQTSASWPVLRRTPVIIRTTVTPGVGSRSASASASVPNAR